MRRLLLLLYFCCWLMKSRAAVDFIHCQGPTDLGGLETIGFYRKSCIQNEHFSNRVHAWNFEKSVIKHSNFTSCGFEDIGDRKQNYAQSHWENVRFEKCHFGPRHADSKTVIEFPEASFMNVVFEDCVFHASAEVVFSSFGLETVTFKNCGFLSKVTLTKGKVDRLSIEQSGFAPYAQNSRSANSSSFLFSEVSVNDLKISNPVGGEFRMQSSTVTDLLMLGGTAERLVCHEEPEVDDSIVLASTLSNTIVVDVGFHDGIYCGHGILNGLQLQDVQVKRNLDLQHSKIERLVVQNLTSLSTGEQGRFSLEEADINGDRIKDVQNIHATFQGALFHRGIHLEGVKISTSLFVLTDTIFSQERINEECCTIACVRKGCKCDVSLEPVTGCPRGNSSVNVNIHDSCFPGDSIISVIQPLSEPQDISMKDLRHGHVVANVIGVDASEVFFFGHRTYSQSALFKVFKGHVIDGGRESKFVLDISPGHMLPVEGRGQIPASAVKIEDVLFTSNGERARVREIRSRVQQGMYAPTTLSGKLSVNGIQVSCYTNTLPPAIAHVSLAPLRALYRSSQLGRELLGRIKVFDEQSGGWILATLRIFLYSWPQNNGSV